MEIKSRLQQSACKFCNLPLQARGADMSELRSCAKRFWDFALMGLGFIYLALLTCLVVYVQKSDFHLINVFCVVLVVKNVLSRPGSLLLFCAA